MKSVQAALNRRKNGEKGFTLVELLVVVIIIGILAAVAVPIYLNQRKAAWRSAVENDVKNASIVMETIATNTGGKYKVSNFTIAETTGLTIAEDGTIAPGGDDNKVVVSTDDKLSFAMVDDADSSKGYIIKGTNTNLKDGNQTCTYDSSTGKMTWSTAAFE